MYYLTVFKQFINFLLDFRSKWPPFSFILDLFDLSFLQNHKSDWLQLFYRVLNTVTENLVKYPDDDEVPIGGGGGGGGTIFPKLKT